MTNIRIGDHVEVIKKVERPSDKNSEWHSRWHPKQDGMIGMVLRVTDVNWYQDRYRGNNWYGCGIAAVDPRIPDRQFFFLPESVEFTQKPLTIVYDADGYAMTIQPGNMYKFMHRGGYYVNWLFNPFCCGVGEIGAFNFDDSKVGDELVKRVIALAVKYRKGVIKGTVVAHQRAAIQVLMRAGFKVRSAFKNPNSSNVVYEMENRTFNGDNERPIEHPSFAPPPPPVVMLVGDAISF